ncbi:hypothetical protein [Neobacillus sp. FSL H8-0543]|uniref:hypothetical protein n=1 Tax=Neobacillus sp. FSL H8-0543 TaxID=2954672 RepID=UPI0031598730
MTNLEGDGEDGEGDGFSLLKSKLKSREEDGLKSREEDADSNKENDLNSVSIGLRAFFFRERTSVMK